MFGSSVAVSRNLGVCGAPTLGTAILLDAITGQILLELLPVGAGAKPKYIIADKDKEFFCQPFKDWCERKGILPRYGAVEKHGCTAIIERFIRALKSECTRMIILPFRLGEMRRELACYATWYNEYRPHTGIGGRTPLEVYRGVPAANEEARFEPKQVGP